MENKPLSNHCRTILSIVTVALLLSSETFLKSLVTVSGSIIVPIKIRFEGELKAGSVVNGSILVTSGTIILGNAVFHVSKTPGEFNEASNYITISQGRLYSTPISLGESYVMRLAAVCTTLDINVIHISFGYGEDYPGSTSILIPRGYGRRSLLINATGVLALSGVSVTISAEGTAVIPDEEREEPRKGCLTVIRKEAPIGETAGFELWGIWGLGGWEDDENYYVPIPQEDSLMLFIFLNRESRLAELLDKYGKVSSSSRGVGIWMNISCRTGNTSIVFLEAEYLKNFLESFASEERDFLSKVGFDAEKYFKEIDYAVMLLGESEAALARGDFETGLGFLEKSVIKAENALRLKPSQERQYCDVSLPNYVHLLRFIHNRRINREKKEANNYRSVYNTHYCRDISYSAGQDGCCGS